MEELLVESTTEQCRGLKKSLGGSNSLKKNLSLFLQNEMKTSRQPENGNQESIINKIFKRITNNHSLQQTQVADILEEEIRMSINLSRFEGTREKLRCILRSHKTRPLSTLKTLCWETDRNFSWDKKKVFDKSRLIPRKIKETIHSLKNSNHINKIFYMLPEMWLPNLR